ncbi:nuclear factor 7, ovary-like [Archocentrus centrarchus]|uniref:nuclear factor 7, ovary-like n=1 Tax=Archocentrus centrarchus TaxID=63155 RepID=UPI0011E9D43B|nr:nuclear factor 7, ovary-like [Archocentrus centrarchus]
MAPGSEDNLRCPVCYDIFKDPVLLSCSHSFCKVCLRRWWRRKETLECPVCKRVSGRKHPPCNLALKNLCEAFLLESDQTSEALCSLHSEKLKLFCLDHEQQVCLICRDSENHANHKFRPIDEAARDHRDELQKSLKPLQEKLKLFEQIKRNYTRTTEHIKVQAQDTRKQIKKQFKRLHRFLEEEEEARIAAVRAEERQKHEVLKEKMEVLRREMAALSRIIRATEEELRAEDTFFLRNYKAAVERVQQHRLLDDPELHRGALIDRAKHLGNLTFNILNRMTEASSFTPVILDPNTAHPRLSLSEDLSGVKWGKRPERPNNPERFSSFCIVLGSEGFKSGVHSWEVELEHSPHWILGVASESIQRKGRLGSQSGLWTMVFHKGKYKASSPSDSVFVLPVKKRMKRVRVCLDCDTGVLSFSDPDRVIHSFSCTSTEALFPLIGTNDKHILKILPDTIILLNNTF